MNGKERILQAAEKHFGARPYNDVSIAPILLDAEVQPPTLYYHFRDKEGLYVAWVETTFAPLSGHLKIGRAATVEDGLAAFAAIYFNVVKFDVQQVVRDIDQLSRDNSKETVYGAYFQAIYEPLCAILIEGTEKGELATGPIGPVADLYLAGLFMLHAKTEQDLAGTAVWFAKRFLRGHHA